ncbi:hypothetical protein AVEN_2822-1 [Araneus ventricosus]|uniref:Uncharacterized protein n=1 Tax=Araneus ventricosus TaxID=182803 RepID=A0A4Y2ENA2_ARAVE|nr:hypothetical protein AVEN_2822-1 [Araneus ventricosus]
MFPLWRHGQLPGLPGPRDASVDNDFPSSEKLKCPTLIECTWLIVKKTVEGAVCSPSENSNLFPLANFSNCGTDGSSKVLRLNHMTGGIRYYRPALIQSG